MRRRIFWCLILLLLLLLFISLLWGLYFPYILSLRNKAANGGGIGGALIFQNVGLEGFGSYIGEPERFVQFKSTETVNVMDAPNFIIDVSLTDTGVTSGIYGLGIQTTVNDNGRITNLVTLPIQVVETIASATYNATTRNFVLEGGQNVNIEMTNSHEYIIGTYQAGVFEGIHVSGTTLLPSNTTCAGNPVDSITCLDISGSTCGSGPIEWSCLPQNMTFNNLYVENLVVLSEEFSGDLGDQTVLNTDFLYVDNSTMTGAIHCPVTTIDQNCFELNGLACTGTLDSTCYPSSLTVSNLNITEYLVIANEITCLGPAISQSCYSLDSITCPSNPVQNECLPERIATINGNPPETLITLTTNNALLNITTFNLHEIQVDTLAELNTVQSIGSGLSIYKQKTGVDLEFRRLSAGTAFQVSSTVNEVQLEAENVIAPSPGIFVAPTITVDQKGRITAIVNGSFTTNSAISLSVSAMDILKQVTLTGLMEFRDVTTSTLEMSQPTDSIVLDLPDTPVTPGLYDDPDNSQRLTVNAEGFITNVAPVQVIRQMGKYTLSVSHNNAAANSNVTFTTATYTNNLPLGAWDGQTFTAPESGLYKFSMWTRGGIGGIWHRYYVNGVNIFPNCAACGNYRVSHVIIYHLTVGDTLQFYIQGNPGPSNVVHMEIISMFY